MPTNDGKDRFALSCKTAPLGRRFRFLRDREGYQVRLYVRTLISRSATDAVGQRFRLSISTM